IFVLLPGAPSQTDTFDLRVGSWTPQNFSPTTINGIDWPGGLLPNLGAQLSVNQFSIIRSCQSTALVHPLLQNWNQIARNPASATGKIAPNIGSVVALEFDPQRKTGQKLPGFLSLNGGGSLAGPGYFSGKYAPFDVAPAAGGLANLSNPDGQAVFTSRYNMLLAADAPVRTGPSPYGTSVDEVADFYSSARTMMYDTAINNAFRFSTADQQKYGNSAFGNACVTARNVVASDLGARYIQLTLGGWDNHQNIYAANAGIHPSARQLDVGLANLIADLAAMPGSQGGTKLDETLIIAKGEFGRTIGNITGQQGRDHYFVHSALIAGGGVRGGRVLGATTPDGAYVADPGWSQQRPVYAEDIAATIYSALGINYTTVRHDDPLGRGFEYIPSTTPGYVGAPIQELFQ
ncbi:MAG TPA: DUF1501 domain-containing protein, partial [Terriglobia bacterium]|nr:DUF1501 domain-containing protein [Terriglobia bacterium]